MLLAFIASLLIALTSWLGVPAPAMALSTTFHPVVIAAGGFFPFFTGETPTNLGVKDGNLADCPTSPNCVNSQSRDAKHFIEPISYSAPPAEVLKQLKTLVQSLPRTEIVAETDRYLYVAFTSSLMGFVDDVEFYLDPGAQVIHVRSASRLGESDLGVNRKRIEAIRDQIQAL